MSENAKYIRHKINSSEFREFCQKEFSKDVLKLEMLRKKKIKLTVFFTLALIVLFITILCLCSEYNPHLLSRDFFVPLLCFIFLLLFRATYLYLLSYKKDAKKIIYPKLFSFIGKFRILDTKTEEKRIKSYVKSLNLFPLFNSFTCDDVLEGTYKGIPVSLSEIHLKRVSHSGKCSSSAKIFKGVLLTFKSFKKIETITVIRQNAIINLFDTSSSNHIELESQEFEDLYDVLADDQIEARYLITPAFMERMVDYYCDNEAGNISLSFEQGNVNIAIHSDKNWFEVPLSRPATEMMIYKKILIEIISILTIIDTLKLDS